MESDGNRRSVRLASRLHIPVYREDSLSPESECVAYRTRNSPYRMRTHSGDVSHVNGQNHYRVAQELFAEITQDLNDNISQFPTKTSYDYQSDFQTLAPEFERKIRTLIAQCEKVASWAASCSETEGRTVQTF